MKRLDPRVKRTRRMLMDALRDLIVDEGYEAVTIRDIVNRAQVNRSTFYLHFRDKQDLFSKLTEELLDEFSQSVRNPGFHYESALHDYETLRQPISSTITLFEHIQTYATLYQTMLVKQDFRERVTQRLKTELLYFSPTEIEAAFTSHGIVGLILYWVEGGMKETVTEMSLWLTRVALFPLGHFE